MKTIVGIRSLFFAGISITMLLSGCGKTNPEEVYAITARLMEEQGRLLIVLHNVSGEEFLLCRRNYYLPLDFIDIKHYPDTSELTFEQIFGKKPCVIKRKDITMSDFIVLPPDQEVRLPVDLRCVKKSRSLGDTVFVSVRFMNIDPFICSRVEVKKYKPEIQQYCELFHYVPNKELHYWSGEIKTQYFAYSLGK